MSQSITDSLVPLSEYRQHRQRFFPSEGSLDWFLRKHRAELIEAGALLLHANKYFANTEAFDGVVVKAGSEAAKRQLEAA